MWNLRVVQYDCDAYVILHQQCDIMFIYIIYRVNIRHLIHRYFHSSNDRQPNVWNSSRQAFF